MQGEGHNTGRAAVFIRFAGCNLRCSFCDTEFNAYREMSDEEIVDAIKAILPSPITHHPSPLIVLTGGEPTLQVDEAFVDLLHQHGYEVAMESNGTRPAPSNLDWLTVSPKIFGEGCLVRSSSARLLPKGRKKGDGRIPDEIKVVFDEDTPSKLSSLHLSPVTCHQFLYLQPCDTGDPVRNKGITQACVEYIKAHPQWRLSLQTHKLIDIE